MAQNIIVFQGDSVTDCGRNKVEQLPNITLGEGYAEMVTARIRADYPDRDYICYNRGISGHRVVDLYARWKIDTINLHPNILSILIGVNDTWHEFARQNGVEPKRYDQIYRMLLDWTREALPETKLLLMEPFVLHFGVVEDAWVTEMAERSKIIRQIAKDYQLPLLPTQEILNDACRKAAPEYWLRDGVHPTLPGHQLIADAWIKLAREINYI